MLRGTVPSSGWRWHWPAVLVLLSMLAPTALGQETYTIRMNMQPGTAWNFETKSDTQMQITAEAGGATHQVQQHLTQIRKGNARVADARNGQITALTITFDPSCENTAQATGQPQQRTPYPLAGKTVTIKLGADGKVTTDLPQQPDAQVMNDLAGMMRPDVGFFPRKPVAVGAGWDADAEAIKPALGLAATDRLSAKCKLMKVHEDNGRKVADIAVTMRAEKKGPLSGEATFGGVIVVDLASGHAQRGDVIGSLNITGQQQQQTPDGQTVAVNVKGTGKTEIHSDDPLTSTAGEGVASGEEAPPPLLTNVEALAGTYKDPRLTVNLVSAGTAQYTGTIQMGQRSFPMKATATGNKLTGTFESGGKTFPFTATFDGGMLNFTTGKTTYKLQKQEPNPLDTGENPPSNEPANPLSPGTTPPVPPPPDSGEPGIMPPGSNPPPPSPSDQGGFNVDRQTRRGDNNAHAARPVVPPEWRFENVIR